MVENRKKTNILTRESMTVCWLIHPSIYPQLQTLWLYNIITPLFPLFPADKNNHNNSYSC